jgi:hypothetical protein
MALAVVEPTLKYQPGVIAVLTWVHYLDRGLSQCQGA